jgi:formimidoylglutamate deiminase
LSTPLNHDGGSDVATTFVPDLLYVGGRFERERGLACDPAGRVLAVPDVGVLRELSGGDLREGETYIIADPESGIVFTTRFVRLRGRAMLPGMVNAHSHAFQRVIRGRTEYRSAHAADSFWTWREMMYAASARLTPEDLYDASRMAFMEMAAGGITSVGEFHYLHRTPEGAEYDDPNLLAREVVRAAGDVGLRIALLRSAYARAGFRRAPDERQRRFIEPDADTFIRNTDALLRNLTPGEVSGAAVGGYKRGATGGKHGGASMNDEHDGGATEALPRALAEALPRAWVGVAPHSVRAVPVEYLREVSAFARARGLLLHMHVAEQPAEVEACLAETNRTPVALLAAEGVLGPRFTGVHAVHITAEEVAQLRAAGACVCACPTTERNLGDGIVPADMLLGAGVRVALGTDSHTQIDLLEDARELEYHLRLRTLRRNVLAPAHDGGEGQESREADADESLGAAAARVGRDAGAMRDTEAVLNSDAVRDAEGREMSSPAARLFECATASGAHSIGAHAGEFAPGRAADFFTVDLNDPSIAGASAQDLLPAIVFSLSRTAVREVAVGGRLVIEHGRHAAQDEIVSRFAALQRRLWGES